MELKHKKINCRIVNAAFWLALALSYILPFKEVDNFRYEVGFPLRFITAYDTDIGDYPILITTPNGWTKESDMGKKQR